MNGNLDGVRKIDMGIKICFGAVVAFCFAIIIFGVISQFSGLRLYDDAFMFVRYADNFIRFGKLSWNPQDAPAYGLTSILYLTAVIPIRLIISAKPDLAASISSIFCGVTFLVLLAVFLWRSSGADKKLRSILILLVFTAMASSINNFAILFISGMDTSFVMSYLCAYLIACKWNEKKQNSFSAVVVGIIGGFAFYARPDLSLYSCIVPASTFVFSSDWKTRKNSLLVAAITIAITAGLISFSYFYFDSALPLSFYIKGKAYYGKNIYDLYKYTSFEQLLIYLSSYWFLFLSIAIYLMIDYRNIRKSFSAVDWGIFFATALFILYYLLFVIQIMYYGQRFYYPTLPAVAYLAFRSAVSLFEKMDAEIKAGSIAIPRNFHLAALIFLLGYLTQSGIGVYLAALDESFYLHVGKFGPVEIYKKYQLKNNGWFRLDAFSDLPDDLVIATTEVGYPAAMNPNKRIIDLAGLNDTEFAHKGFSAQTLIEKYRPDLIYMPHPHYVEMLDEITNNIYFSMGYDLFSDKQLDAFMGIAIRRDSKYYKQMKDSVLDRINGNNNEEQNTDRNLR